MPALPSVSLTIRDPGIPKGSVPRMTPIVMGHTKGGTTGTLKWYDSPGAAITEHVDGPALDMVLKLLAKAGGPVGLLCMATSVAADNSAVTKVGSHSGPDVTVAGTARVDHFVEIEVTSAGALGVGKFRYNLDGFSGATDNQKTWSDNITIPSGGEYVIPNTDLTLTFASGTYGLGEAYTFTAECAASNVSDLTAAFNVLAATTREYRFLVLVTSANTGVASAHATLAATFESELNSLANIGIHRRGMMAADIAADDSAVAAAYVSSTLVRTNVLFADLADAPGKPFVGYARPRKRALASMATRAARVRISTDLKRVKSGPLDCLEQFTDERVDATGLDDLHISTIRTWPGLGGPFLSQGRLKSAIGSDFDIWPRGTVMDLICDIVYQEQVRFIGQSLRTNPGPDVGEGLNAAGVTVGAIDPRDIERLQRTVQSRLDNEVMNQANEEGTQGHASGVKYLIDPTHNFQATDTVISHVNGVPLSYPSRVDTSVGWSSEL